MKQTADLFRFIQAQENTYIVALAEIKKGKKRSHWMWFIFPQLLGLGQSEMSKRFGIKDREEALAYLGNAVLGQRLIEISKELLNLNASDAYGIFGSPDDQKLKSPMTLFDALETSGDVFNAVLDQFFKGSRDEKTLALMGSGI